MQQIAGTKQGFKQTQLGEIPEEWDIVTMKQVVKSYRNGIYKLPKFYGSGIPSIRMFNIENGKINSIGAPLLEVTDQELTDYELKLGDILINRVNSKELVGKAGIVGEGLGKVTFESKNIRIRVFTDRSDPHYINYFLNSKLYYKQIHSKTKAAVGQCTINQEDLNNLYICLPTLREQQKIVTILSKVDELIQKADQVIEQTQRLKKGLTQRLLTRGIGHTKFKEATLGFRFLKIKIPESWQLLELRQVSINGVQNGIFKRREEFGKGIPIVNVSDLFSDSDIAVDRLERVTVTQSELRQFSIKEGDIFFCRSSLVSDGIGHSNTITYLSEPAVFECHTMMSRPDKKKVVPKFLAYYTQSEIAKKFLLSVSMTLTMTTIRQPDLESLPVPIPPLQEQEKIISILSSIDSKIQKEQRCRFYLKNLKKGLIQKLLTGKIRVKV